MSLMWTQRFAPTLDTTRPAVMQAHGLRADPEGSVLQSGLDLVIPAGLSAIVGGEGRGKTHLLHVLCGLAAPQAGEVSRVSCCCLDLRLPHDDAHTPEQVWQALRAQHPAWDPGLQDALVDALGLKAHLGKALFQLSTGSRRKVGLVASLASGATVTGLDQPCIALDMASVAVLQEVLSEASEHPRRAWLVADHEADAALPWASIIDLGE